MTDASPPPPSSMPVQPVGAHSDAQLASAGARIGAALLDGLLVVVTLGIGWLIWSIVLWKQSTSPAKKMLHMTILDANTGQPASMKQMVLREVLGKLVLGAVTGFISLVSAIMLFVTPRRQVVWDYIGTTVVVRNAA